MTTDCKPPEPKHLFSKSGAMEISKALKDPTYPNTMINKLIISFSYIQYA